MEIELPDGTVLEAPDGADASAVAKKYLKNQRTAALKKSNPGEYDSSSPEWQDKYGPTAGMSTADKFFAGVGKGVVDTGRGIRQLGIEALNLVRPEQPQDAVNGTPAEQYRQHMDEVNALDAPLMRTGAGITGDIAGNLAATMVPAGIVASSASKIPALARVASVAKGFINPTTIRGAMLAGAATGALQPVGSEQSRAMNTLTGGALGGATQAVVKGIGAIAQPLKRALSPVDEKAVQVLEDAGVPLDAAQKSGSERAMQVKRFLTDNPLTGAGQVAQAEKTATGFTRAALKHIGETADVADEAVLGRASQRIGGEFDRIAANNPIKFDNKLLNDLANITSQAKSTLEGAQAALIERQADEILSKGALGPIDGKAYQNFKTTLDLISKNPNQQIGGFARQLRSSLDDALQRSASKADYEALKVARRQYSALDKIIQATNPDGQVSPSKLYNALNVKAYGQKKAMQTGIRQTELQTLAKAGKRVIPERLPNSGTTPRALLQMALPAGVGAGYGYAKEGDLSGAAKYAALGIGLPYLAQKALNSPAASDYLAYGLQGPARAALLSSQSVPASLLLRQAPTVGLLSQVRQQ